MKSKLVLLFNVFYILIFGATALLVFGKNSRLKWLGERKIWMNPLTFILATLLLCLIYYGIYKLLLRCDAFFIKYEYLVVGLLFVIFVAIGLYVAWLLEVKTMCDVEAVYRGAINWARDGQLGEYTAYLYKYPNNLSSLLIYGVWLKLTAFIHNTAMSCNLLNVFATGVTVFFIWKVIRDKKGALVGINWLFIVLTCLPLYMYIAVWYSDTLALPFVAASLYLFDKAVNTKKSYLLYVLTGIVIGVGCAIKMTVIVIAVAIVIYSILKLRKFEKAYCILVIIGILIILSLNGLIKNTMLPDSELTEKYAIPYEHWVMMGLKGDGSFNLQDEEYTMSFENRTEAARHNREEIVNRLQANGVIGSVVLYIKKTNAAFTDGTFNVASMLDDFPVRENKIHKYVLIDSEYYYIFVYACSIYWFIILGRSVLAVIFEIKNKTYELDFCFLARLSWFGLWCFLMLWETNARYVYHFLPIVLLSNAGSIIKQAALKR